MWDGGETIQSFHIPHVKQAKARNRMANKPSIYPIISRAYIILCLMILQTPHTTKSATTTIAVLALLPDTIAKHSNRMA